jgi:hypothetical protein
MKVTVTTETVTTISLSLTLEEAAYVAAVLGNSSAYETCERAGVPQIKSPYFELAEAVSQNGGDALIEKLARADCK